MAKSHHNCFKRLHKDNRAIFVLLLPQTPSYLMAYRIILQCVKWEFVLIIGSESSRSINIKQACARKGDEKVS